MLDPGITLTLLPGRYKILHIVGSGLSGDVHFAIDSEPNTKNRQLVAIKIPKYVGVKSEVSILRKIRNDMPGKLLHTFPEVIDADTEHLECHWFVLTAVNPSINLLHFRQTVQPSLNLTVLPNHSTLVPFIAHIFIQLHEAVNFLHKECKIFHGDLHEANILLRMQKDALPSTVVLDFGLADSVGSFAGVNASMDWKGLCKIASRLANGFDAEARNAKSDVIFDRWRDFRTLMKEIAIRPGDLLVSMEDIWKAYGTLLEDWKSKASTEDISLIDEILQGLKVPGKNFVMDEDIHNALEEVESG